MPRSWVDTERWDWYAAGDKAVAPPAVSRPGLDNSPDRIAWELGLAVLAPLVLAAIAGIALS